jgi:hypothetical protein
LVCPLLLRAWFPDNLRAFELSYSQAWEFTFCRDSAEVWFVDFAVPVFLSW